MPRATLVISATLLVTASPAQPGESVETDTPLCREVIAEHPGDALEALRKAEGERVRTAKSSYRKARKRLGRSLGGGPGAVGQRDASGAGTAMDVFERNIAEARVLCECRELRGDPHRQDCERLYFDLRVPGRR